MKCYPICLVKTYNTEIINNELDICKEAPHLSTKIFQAFWHQYSSYCTVSNLESTVLTLQSFFSLIGDCEAETLSKIKGGTVF